MNETFLKDEVTFLQVSQDACCFQKTSTGQKLSNFRGEFHLTFKEQKYIKYKLFGFRYSVTPVLKGYIISKDMLLREDRRLTSS